MNGKQTSIGAGWRGMSERSDPPTRVEREAQAESIRAGLPPVRHKVQMRYERIFGVWTVSLSEGSEILRECRFESDQKIEEMVQRGRGFSCLADRQAVEFGIRSGLGIATLYLDSEQYAALTQPR